MLCAVYRWVCYEESACFLLIMRCLSVSMCVFPVGMMGCMLFLCLYQCGIDVIVMSSA